MQKHFSGSKSLKRSSVEYRSKPKHSMSNGESNDKAGGNRKISQSTNVQKPSGVELYTNPVSIAAKHSVSLEHAPPASKSSNNKPAASASVEKEFEPPISSKPASAENAYTSEVDASMTTENRQSNGGEEKEESSSEADPVVVTAKTDSGKEVKVTQKESITSTEATANGSQKRTFSTT
jgi:hypothetical protein